MQSWQHTRSMVAGMRLQSSCCHGYRHLLPVRALCIMSIAVFFKSYFYSSYKQGVVLSDLRYIQSFVFRMNGQYFIHFISKACVSVSTLVSPSHSVSKRENSGQTPLKTKKCSDRLVYNLMIFYIILYIYRAYARTSS